MLRVRWREFPRHMNDAPLERAPARKPAVTGLGLILVAEERHALHDGLQRISLRLYAAIRNRAHAEGARLTALVRLAIQFQQDDAWVDELGHPGALLLALWRNAMMIVGFLHPSPPVSSSSRLGFMLGLLHVGDRYADRAV